MPTVEAVEKVYVYMTTDGVDTRLEVRYPYGTVQKLLFLYFYYVIVHHVSLSFCQF